MNCRERVNLKKIDQKFLPKKVPIGAISSLSVKFQILNGSTNTGYSKKDECNFIYIRENKCI